MRDAARSFHAPHPAQQVVPDRAHVVQSADGATPRARSTNAAVARKLVIRSRAAVRGQRCRPAQGRDRVVGRAATAPGATTPTTAGSSATCTAVRAPIECPSSTTGTSPRSRRTCSSAQRASSTGAVPVVPAALAVAQQPDADPGLVQPRRDRPLQRQAAAPRGAPAVDHLRATAASRRAASAPGRRRRRCVERVSEGAGRVVSRVVRSAATDAVRSASLSGPVSARPGKMSP